MQSWNILKKDEKGNKYDIRIKFINNTLLIDDVGFIPKKKKANIFRGRIN